jgi:hypothetical protein
MAKINRTFRLDDLADKKLAALSAHFTLQNSMSGIPGKKISKTDILEFLISEKYVALLVDGYELDIN